MKSVTEMIEEMGLSDVEDELNKVSEGEGVFTKINRVMSILCEQGISKSQKNDAQGWSFRGIDDLYNAVGPAMASVGLVCIPCVKSKKVREHETPNGRLVHHYIVEMEYAFVSTDDESVVVATTYGEAMDHGDKGMNKAMSSAYKYALFQTFHIPTQAQDPDFEIHEVKKKGAVADALDGIEVDQDQVAAYTHAIRMCLDSEDQQGWWQLADELNDADLQDIKIAVWGKLDAKSRRTLKDWSNAKDE